MNANPVSVSKIASRKRRSERQAPVQVWSFAINGLFVLALAYTAYIARPVLIPALIGFLMSMILATPVRKLTSWKVPRSLASAVMIVITFVAMGLPLYLLSEPASTWIEDMPRTASDVAERVRGLTVPIKDVQEVAAEVEKLATLDETDATPTVRVAPPGLARTLLDTAPRAAMAGLFAFFLAFLFLSSGDAMLRKIICMVCALDDQRRAFLITRRIQQDLFRYLSAVTGVNIVLGATTAGILYALDVPNALFWGAVAALGNYAPLVGPAVTIVLLFIVGVTTFEETGRALLVPFSYFILTTLEGQLISPAVIGRRLALSPVVVLLSLVTLGWMWGIAGLLLAVPIASSARIICANIPRFNRVAVLLGR